MALSPRWWRPWRREEPTPMPEPRPPEQQAEETAAQRALRRKYAGHLNNLAVNTEVARKRFDVLDAFDVHLQYVLDSALRRNDDDDRRPDEPGGGGAGAGNG